jgi:hypothetical protein
MVSSAIDGRKGVPAVSQLTWFWALVFTFFSSGLFALGMALHISRWVRQKRKAGLAFLMYLLLTLGLALGLVPDRFFPKFFVWESLVSALSLAAVVLWIGGAFVLRRELMLYYASPVGSTLEISPWWTALFSIYYLNYCLWVVRDSA